MINEKRLLIYCAESTHTWIEKASNLFGLGSDSIRWIPSDKANRMDCRLLRETIDKDLENGLVPMMVVGTAGDVSTGSVDDLTQISKICQDYDLWFHVDGAYGLPANILPEMQYLFEGLNHADSIAIDPHKWLYSPLEAGMHTRQKPTAFDRCLQFTSSVL